MYSILSSIVVSLILVSLSPFTVLAQQNPVDDEIPPIEIEVPRPGVDVPFEITEDRVRCDNYAPLRQPLFGTTHLHTGLSFDASTRFVETTPSDAYNFAMGNQPLILPNSAGVQNVEVWIDRPTDWGMVTDHSEHFGEIGVCKDFLGINVPGRTSLDCRLINGFYWGPNVLPIPAIQRGNASSGFQIMTVMNDGPTTRNTRMPLCLNTPGDSCTLAEQAVWGEMQSVAEQFYDRSSSCEFTTFVAYEMSSTPSGTNWHRNVIFRNDRVLNTPITAIDLAVEPNEDPTSGGPNGVGVPPNYIGIPPLAINQRPQVEKLWAGLERECLLGENITDGVGFRCDVLAIPHNSNLGGGQSPFIPPQWFTPVDLASARSKLRIEPLVEIYQDKGSSECRWDPRFDKGVQTMDEFCDFELLDTGSLLASTGATGGGSSEPTNPDDIEPRSYVRNILKDGLLLARDMFGGFNPFKVGIVASSDSHTGTMGWHPENAEWPGHLGIDDAIPVRSDSSIQNSSGGHTVVWAEENSRDSIFEALKRKETYGTSGTRMVVRFFGGWDFGDGSCNQNFLPMGYTRGVPMGGTLPPRPFGAAGPRFVAAAWKDETPLEQIQIIKGWVDAQGNTQEEVLRIAGYRGFPDNPQVTVDNETCALIRPDIGANVLCTVWEDTNFDPTQSAFYYVRVLERPVCRYSTLYCMENFDLNPLKPDQCLADLAILQQNNPTIAQNAMPCCNNEMSNAIVQPVIQERAWTSPIWYEP